MESRSSGRFAARQERSGTREHEPPQTLWNERRSSALAEMNKKLAPTHVNRPKISRSRRLPFHSQSDFPRRVTCGTETNIRIWAGQGEACLVTRSDWPRLW